MQKTLMLLIMAISVLPLTACKPNPDMIRAAPAQSDSTAITEAKTAKALTKAVVSASENQLTHELICTKLSQTINKIDNTSKIEDIDALERQLNACLPIADNSEILEWLTDYQTMYARFLSIDPNMYDENFYTIISLAEQQVDVPSELLKTASPRLRYLIKLVQSDTNVSVQYLGEGDYQFHHDLQTMADIFTPYLPSDQTKFVERMAMDNQQIFWFDAAIAFSFNELIERTLFWEAYSRQYPDSYFTDEAKSLFDKYRYLLFFGSENTQWTDDTIHNFYDSKDQQTMQEVALIPNQLLAKDAQIFLEFMTLSDSERQQKYPVALTDDDKLDERALAYLQLEQALSLSSPWSTINKNCSAGVICVDND